MNIQISPCMICNVPTDAIAPEGQRTTVDLLCEPCAENEQMVFVGDRPKFDVVWRWWDQTRGSIKARTPGFVDLGEIGREPGEEG